MKKKKNRELSIFETNSDGLKILKIVTKSSMNTEDFRILFELIESIRSNLESNHLGVLDHTALLYFFNCPFRTQLSRTQDERLVTTLQQSWSKLTNLKLPPYETIPYLPQSILDQTPEAIRLLYVATYHKENRKYLLFDKIQNGQPYFKTILTRLRNSAFWNMTFAFCTLLALAACIFSEGRELLIGILLGMISASFNEYLIHLGVGHASPNLSLAFRRFGWLGRFAEEINLAHRVHHCKIATDFRVEFSDSKTLERVNHYLEHHARKIVTSRIQNRIISQAELESEINRIVVTIRAGGYGVNGTLKGAISMQLTAVPFYIINYLIYKLAFGPIFLITSFLSLAVFINQSLYSHRYLHMTNADIENAKLSSKATSFMIWFMATPLGKLQQRRHFRHHQEAFDYKRTVNGVIMSFSFADYILRRGVADATVRNLLQMHDQDFLR